MVVCSGVSGDVPFPITETMTTITASVTTATAA
jgi:hypothetical protein